MKFRLLDESFPSDEVFLDLKRGPSNLIRLVVCDESGKGLFPLLTFQNDGTIYRHTIPAPCTAFNTEEIDGARYPIVEAV